MLCRNETVITFQSTAKKVAKAVRNQNNCQEEVRPIIRQMIGAVSKVRYNDGPLPILAEILGPKIPPNVPPTAPAVPRIAKINTEV